MKKILFFILCLPLLLFSCDIHEWPDVEEKVPLLLSVKCNFLNLKWTEWEHFEGTDEGKPNVGDTYTNELTEGKLRYTVRAVPASGRSRNGHEDYQEYVFYKDVADQSDLTETLYMSPGEYDIMVWADYMKKGTDEAYYRIDDFSEIMLNGDITGNNDYHDAYRGVGTVTLVSDVNEGEPVVSNIEMQRPLAKLELITNDLMQFIGKEEEKKSGREQTTSADEGQEAINWEDYKVVFYYVGYRPVAYSMYTDRPVDSVTGAFFESTLKQLNDNEASLGFDYVFINGTESAVTVQIGIYDKAGVQLSVTEPIKIPLKRNFHTKVYGSFLMSNASGGINVIPDYEGDYNLMIP